MIPESEATKPRDKDKLRETIEGMLVNLKAIMEDSTSDHIEEVTELDKLPDILTASIIAEYLNLSSRRVYELMDLVPEAGGIPSFKIGKSKRVFKKDLESWLDAKRGGS